MDACVLFEALLRLGILCCEDPPSPAAFEIGFQAASVLHMITSGGIETIGDWSVEVGVTWVVRRSLWALIHSCAFQRALEITSIGEDDRDSKIRWFQAAQIVQVIHKKVSPVFQPGGRQIQRAESSSAVMKSGHDAESNRDFIGAKSQIWVAKGQWRKR